MKCAWCDKEIVEGYGVIHSQKYNQAFCNRSHFASWKFYKENYSSPIFRWFR